MHDRRELAATARADALRRRIGVAQFGVRGLERFELAQQRVVLGVGIAGVVEHVVAVVGVVELLAQLRRRAAAALAHALAAVTSGPVRICCFSRSRS